MLFASVARVAENVVFETGKNMINTINIELYTDERDFIINLIGYALLDELLNNLKRAKLSLIKKILLIFAWVDMI